MKIKRMKQPETKQAAEQQKLKQMLEITQTTTTTTPTTIEVTPMKIQEVTKFLVSGYTTQSLVKLCLKQDNSNNIHVHQHRHHVHQHRHHVDQHQRHVDHPLPLFITRLLLLPMMKDGHLVHLENHLITTTTTTTTTMPPTTNLNQNHHHHHNITQKKQHPLHPCILPEESMCLIQKQAKLHLYDPTMTTD